MMLSEWLGEQNCKLKDLFKNGKASSFFEDTFFR